MTQLSRMLINDEIDENSTVYIDAKHGTNELKYEAVKTGGLINEITGVKSDILITIPDGKLDPQSTKRVKIEMDGIDDMED